MYLHAVLHYIWKSFSERKEELPERADSLRQTLENQSAEEEAIIYLQ